VRVLPGHALWEWLSIMGSRVAGACAAAGTFPTLPVGRESCTAGRVAFLNALGKGWPVPCPNTPRVAGPLRGHARGEAARVHGVDHRRARGEDLRDWRRIGL